MTGLRARWGPVTVVLAPEYLYSENLPFQALPYPIDADPPPVSAAPTHTTRSRSRSTGRSASGASPSGSEVE